jgi:hypothetical protein
MNSLFKVILGSHEPKTGGFALVKITFEFSICCKMYLHVLVIVTMTHERKRLTIKYHNYKQLLTISSEKFQC